MQNERAIVTRRDLLSLIGAVSGSAAMYHAMTSPGFASDSGGPDETVLVKSFHEGDEYFYRLVKLLPGEGS